MVNRVVVAKMDGTRLRGYVYDVNTAKEEFHLFASEAADEKNAEIVNLRECKAVCFVKSLTGNPNYQENKTELPERKRFGRGMEVVFADGERILGTAEFYNPDKLGFYLIPPDPRSNNLRIFVVIPNARSVTVLGEKTGAGADGQWVAPDPVGYPHDKRSEVVLRLLRGTPPDRLSLDVWLPVPVMQYWKDAFVAAGSAALSDVALALARQGDPGDGEERDGGKPDRTPEGKRLEIVLAALARADEAVLSQENLVPVRLLAGWRERFLDAGRAAVKEQAAVEDGESPDTVRARYEGLSLRAPDGRSERDSFLDGLSDLFGDTSG
jgi:hypothetical protein